MNSAMLLQVVYIIQAQHLLTNCWLIKLERKMLTIKSEIKEQKLDGTYNVKFFLSIFLKGVVGYAEN